MGVIIAVAASSNGGIDGFLEHSKSLMHTLYHAPTSIRP